MSVDRSLKESLTAGGTCKIYVKLFEARTTDCEGDNV